MATFSEVLDMAGRYCQTGRLGKAEKVLRDFLQVQPKHAGARHRLGVILHNQRKFAEAVSFLQQALSADPGNVRIHDSLGLVLQDLRRFDEAVAAFQQALHLDPRDVSARINLGNTLRSQGKLDDAITTYRMAIEYTPNSAQAHSNLGSALRAAGRREEAVASYRQALVCEPDHAPAHLNLGNVLQDLQHYEEAAASYRQALAIKSDYADAHHQLGLVLWRLEQLNDATASLEHALALRPDDAQILNDLGMLLADRRQHARAVHGYRQALALQPGHAQIHNNLGNSLRLLGQMNEALACYQRALELNPKYPTVYFNLGNFFQDLGSLSEADTNFSQAIALSPDYAEAHFQRACVWLLQGDWERAWPQYEWRWRMKRIQKSWPGHEQPRWEGEPLAGKTILLWAEQGLGDTMQFIRYVPLVKQSGATVAFVCQRPLMHMVRHFSEIDQLITKDDSPPRFDVHCPLLSLPRVFNTKLETIPGGVPYLFATDKRRQQWRTRLADFDGFKIGIGWQGSVTYLRDHLRSIPLKHFAPVADIKGVRLFSLQKGPGAEQLTEWGQSFGIIDLSTELDTGTDAFIDTAAVMMELDLIVTSDTSIAHLAGALGVPVWVVLNYVPEWRFLLNREDSPWYPTMRLFRQRRFGDWDEVFQRVREELLKTVSHEPTSPSTSSKSSQIAKPVEESERRKQVIAEQRTDFERWRDPNSLEAAWDKRAWLAADFVPAGAAVLDLGCGAMTLEKFLPHGCTYIPCDLVARDERTLVRNLNENGVPDKGGASFVTLLGVLEYLYDVPAILAQLCAYELPILLSYSPTNKTAHLDRLALGWVNDYSEDELHTLFENAGFLVRTHAALDGNQQLYLLNHGRVAHATMRDVLVLSFFHVGNFGDRLGFHLLNDVLPPHTRVHHAHFDVANQYAPTNVPDRNFDLFILGIGNSLFDPVLTDNLLALLDRVPKCVGIFGTQYRQAIQVPRLQAVLQRLDRWFARYEEDTLLYGRGGDNVEHLGDWLINAFPLHRATLDRTLEIGDEIKQDLPLDRSIQKIQQYKRVLSSRVHPLLCAMTSAEQVAYREQPHQGQTTGKFRSLLIDVFGRTFPPEQFFAVDHDAVAKYKVKVGAATQRLRRYLEEILPSAENE